MQPCSSKSIFVSVQHEYVIAFDALSTYEHAIFILSFRVIVVSTRSVLVIFRATKWAVCKTTWWRAVACRRPTPHPIGVALSKVSNQKVSKNNNLFYSIPRWVDFISVPSSPLKLHTRFLRRNLFNLEMGVWEWKAIQYSEQTNDFWLFYAILFLLLLG